MALTPGTRLGPYEVVAQIGVGGMGEVYRATDTNLARQVAIKVLPAAFAQDAERLARFEREAKTLALLNHPNIATIHGVQKAPGSYALVMELVEGPTLADRIAQGPIPIGEALPIAKQIAEALEAAHEQGIIHRDLKPANIKVRSDGTVKVLDFGLAKAMEPTGAMAPSVSMSPTITTPAMMTGVGMILGTAAYMSPEQARGKPVDKRSDIWAFGCVLFEMLTGRRAFDGDDVSDTLANVLKSDPDWSRLPDDTPRHVRQAVRACLQKVPKERLGDAQSVRLVLAGSFDAAAPAGAASYQHRRLAWAVAAASVTLAAFLGVRLWLTTTPTAPESVVRVDADIGVDAVLQPDSPVISDDGTLLAFVARPATGAAQLYVRALDQKTARPLPGTENAERPFFSPDSQWLAFFAERRLKKLPVAGGDIVSIAEVPGTRGRAVWSASGDIVLSQNTADGSGRLVRVPASGGSRAYVLPPDGLTRRWPFVLPNGNAVVVAEQRSAGNFDNANVVAYPLAGGKPSLLLQGGFNAQYIPTGHLLYMREQTLFGVPFDPKELRVTGPAVPIIEGVDAGSYSVSRNGTLVYVSREIDSSAPMYWMDRRGNTSLLRPPSNWNHPQFSPDGRLLAMDIDIGGNSDIWVLDVVRGAVVRLTSDPASDDSPTWTPDGKRVVFMRAAGPAPGGRRAVYWQRPDGTDTAALLFDPPGAPTFRAAGSDLAWEPDGRAFFIGIATDIFRVTVSGSESTGWKADQPVIAVPGGHGPAVSPDGQWLAYWSTETGDNAVFVKPLSRTGGTMPVSTGYGVEPIWSPDGRELLYRTRGPSGDSNNLLMAVPYSVSAGTFVSQLPRPWSTVPWANRPFQHPIAVHPDGNRIVMAPINASDERPQNRVGMIFNVFEVLRRLAPATTQ